MNRFKYIATVVVAFGAMACAVVAAPQASADSTFQHEDPNVTCRTFFDVNGNVTGRRIFVESKPKMFVAGTTQQWKASWQPILYLYNTASGGFTTQAAFGPELVGLTGNGFVGASGFGLPYWSGWFNVSQGYSFRLAILYRWYWGGSVYHSELVWAGTHYADAFLIGADGHLGGSHSFGSDYYCFMQY
jgi:hypothetical protein